MCGSCFALVVRSSFVANILACVAVTGRAFWGVRTMCRDGLIVRYSEV